MGEMTERRSTVVAVNGLTMHVLEAGAGPATLLLHGFPQSWRMWCPLMARLEPRRRLIAPDLRGAGRTTAPERGYGSEAVQQDVLQLLAHYDLDRVDLIAHDWGALVGFDLCLNHPERVRRFVAIAVPPPSLRLSRGLIAGMLRAMPHLWFQWVIATPIIGPRLLSRGRQRLARWLLRGFEAQPMNTDDVDAYVATLREPGRAAAASQLYRHLILPGFVAIIRGAYTGRVLRTPTLVLFGADDALLPKDALRVRKQDAPDTRIEFVPGGGHFLVDDAPDAVAQRITAFLDDGGDGGSEDGTPMTQPKTEDPMDTKEADEQLTLRLEQHLPAPPAAIFDACTDPPQQREWLSALGPEAGHVTTSVDLRIGGRWESTFLADPKTAVHDVQTYRVIDRPSRLVTDLVGESTVDGREMPTVRARIDLAFAAEGRGTRVTVRQSGFADRATRDFFTAVVWPAALERIGRCAAARTGAVGRP